MEIINHNNEHTILNSDVINTDHFERIHEFDEHNTSYNPSILLHPTKREALYLVGQELFNDEKFFEAHEAWEHLWHLEKGLDRNFIQALIQVAGHFVHLKCKNYSGAYRLGMRARQKLMIPAHSKFYESIDIQPIISSLIYNQNQLELTQSSGVGAEFGEFLIPKLF